MKKTNKIIVALCIILTIIAISVVSYGSTVENVLNGLNGNANVNTTKITNMGNSIVSVVRVVGIIIAVVILLVLGIKYMMGSAEEKADYKKSMIPYIVGAILIFASSTIVGVVYDMANALNGTTAGN